MQSPYKRILIKLSGEAIGDNSATFQQNLIVKIAEQIKQLQQLNLKIGIVIGGGNLLRGNTLVKEYGLEQANADYMAMLATVINALAVQNIFSNAGINCKIHSALSITNIIPEYNLLQMRADLSEDNVIIFAGGTGNPYCTTDSAAAIRAIDMQANVIIKITKVDGIYDVNPINNPKAKKFTHLSFAEAIERNLKIMDIAAFSTCRDYNIDIIVCSLFMANSLYDAALGKNIGSTVCTQINVHNNS